MKRSISIILLVALLSAGCTSYYETSLQEIESHPDQIADKKVRVYYAAPSDSIAVMGQTARERFGTLRVVAAPDSVVSLRVAAVHFPILAGASLSAPKVYGNSPDSTRPLEVDVTASRKVEVRRVSSGKTVLLVGGIVFIYGFIYAVVHGQLGPY